MRLLLPLIFLACSASAQILNGGFESWTNGNPDSWYASNVPGLWTTITKSTTAYRGSASARGEVIAVGGSPVGVLLQGGANLEGFPMSTRPASLQVYYQYSPQGGDAFALNVLLYKSGTPVASGATKITAAASGWTLYNLPLTYISKDTPDLCVVQILIANNASLHAGSYFLVDEVAFVGTAPTGVADDVHTPVSFELKQNYPNPFNPATTISYGIPTDGNVQVKVYNSLGTEVATVFDAHQTAGTHAVVFNASGLASGTYFVSLRHDGQHVVRPMLLLK
jgi:hypothetical protein